MPGDANDATRRYRTGPKNLRSAASLKTQDSLGELRLYPQLVWMLHQSLMTRFMSMRILVPQSGHVNGSLSTTMPADR